MMHKSEIELRMATEKLIRSDTTTVEAKVDTIMHGMRECFLAGYKAGALRTIEEVDKALEEVVQL